MSINFETLELKDEDDDAFIHKEKSADEEIHVNFTWHRKISDLLSNDRTWKLQSHTRDKNLIFTPKKAEYETPIGKITSFPWYQ